MKFLSVCSGIDAASVAWNPLGWEAVGFSEIEKFPSAVLAHHYPNIPNYGDLTRYSDWPDDLRPDLVVGGTPCQSFSVAGLRRGLDDPRGNLTLVFLGLLERTRPRWVVWENVPGVLSDKTGALHSFLDGLEDIGYYIAGIDILDAQWNGLAQRRRRLFVVARLVSDLLKLKTPTCRLTVIQCLAEILLETLDVLSVQLNPGVENLESKNGDPAALLKKKIKQFGLESPKVKPASALLEKLVELRPSSEREQNDWGLATGRSNQATTGGIESEHAEGGLTGSTEGCRSTEPCWRTILADALQVANESITSTVSSQTIESKIYICAKAIPFITRFILNSTPSCENFWSAASSCSIALTGFTNYARQTSSSLFGDSERLSWWDDFAGQAEQANQAILNSRVEHFGEILPLSESLRGDSPPRRETGEGVAQNVAGSLGGSSRQGGWPGTDLDGHGAYIPEVAGALCRNDHGGLTGQEAANGQIIPVAYHTSGNCGAWPTGDKTDALTTSTDPNSHVIAFSCKDHGADAGEQSPTLRSMGHDGSHANGGGQVAVAFAENSRAEVRLEGGDGERTGALSTGGGKPGQGVPMVAEGYTVHGTDGTAKAASPTDVAGCLRTKAPGATENSSTTVALHAARVRRLTPVECERLQGFPDNYTLIPGTQRRLRKGSDLAEAIAYLMSHGLSERVSTELAHSPDGPRYKALGNSMAVPVMRWIGERIQAISNLKP